MSDAEIARQDALYENETWAKMARLAGFRPYDTESSARMAFRAMEPMFQILTEISQLWVDDDGDVILGADEYGVNQMLTRIHAVLGTGKPLMIEVFPMTADGGLAELHDEVHAWDVMLRHEGGHPLKEFEDLTAERRDAIVEYLQEYYPFAVVDWGAADLLQ